MKLSACLIVKNEEEMLERTLPNLSRAVDEIIVVDTGSQDNTIAVAQGFGAKVFSSAWTNNFAASRNVSLKAATGDWIIWIDADEYLRLEDLSQIKELISHTTENAYTLTLYESKLGQCERKNGYLRVKLFRNGLGYHFIRPINEQLVDEKENIVIGQPADLAIYHWGKDLAAARLKEKRERYVVLYSQALKAQPDDQNLHFLLANNLSGLNKQEEAMGHYQQAYQLAPGTEIGLQAQEAVADLYLRLKNFVEAARSAEEILKKYPDNIPAGNILASVFLVFGKVDLAIDILLEILQIKNADKVENLYKTQAMPNFLLAKAYEIKGEQEKAQGCYAKVKEIAPEMMGVN